MTVSLTSQLYSAFSANGERPCMIVPGRETWRYAELQALVGKMAGALGAAGIEPGDRVLVQVDKSVEAVALYLACLWTGAVYVPINTAYTPDEVSYFLGDARPRMFICRTDDPGVVDVAGAVATLTLGPDGQGSLMREAERSRPRHHPLPREESDLAAVVYTSGTTGRSKGAMLTQQNLLSNARTLIDCWGWRDDDVLLHALPIFHVHGLFVALHCALLTGTCQIFLARFDADEVIEQLPGATVMMGVPTFYTRLLGRPRFGASTCAHMRVFISGSAPLTEPVFQEWEQRTGHRILERYGMSETAMISSNPLIGERVAGTVGYALPGVDVRIVDDDGNRVDPGEVGIIEVRGPNVFKGYWGMPEKTREEFRADGYFVTGDLGRMDLDGRITLVGRAKDLVISGGYNVYPKEVELLIDEVPGVAESAVIGVPHPDFGEGVVAVVVPETDAVSEDSVLAALAGRLARFKQPKRVVNVAELPRNAMGKVQKQQLRERYTSLFADAHDS